MIRFIVALLAIFIPVEAMADDMTAFDMLLACLALALPHASHPKLWEN